MAKNVLQFDLLEYLARHARDQHSDQNGDLRIPPLNDLSKEYGIGIASLREQLGVARALGVVEVRPRTGIRHLPYSFAPAVRESLSYALHLDRKNFEYFSDLRKHIEADYWDAAVRQLTPADKDFLSKLIEQAWEKLENDPVRLPHKEHRQLHLTIYKHLENPFVMGILESYWDAYEEVGLNRYEELKYLKGVWEYHRNIVNAICENDFVSGYSLLLEHMDLIGHRYIK